MATTRSQQQQQLSTYKTHRFNFVGSPQSRDGTTLAKDQRFVNVFPELIKSNISEGKKYYLKKRAGVAYSGTSAAAGTARGIFIFGGNIYTVIGNQIAKNGVFVCTISNSTGPVGFTAYSGTFYDAVVVLDGISGWVLPAGGGFNQIVSADFPTPHITTPIYIDGYLFVAKVGTNDIYNCDLGDPLVWSPGNFIASDLYPDNIIGLSKNGNYLYCLGTETVEYFYNAGIATGSPLQRNSAAAQQMGCSNVTTLVQSDKEVVFVGTTTNGGRTIWSIDGFKATEIGLEPVRMSLDVEGTLDTASAYCIRTMGHKFYVLNLTNRTWVYDFEEGMWSEWSSTDDSHPFIYKYGAGTSGVSAGVPYLLHPTNGAIMVMTDTAKTDAATTVTTIPIYCSATSLKVDFDTVNRKMCFRFTLLGDSPNGATDCPISVSWSDDDYVTWSTPVTLNINGDMPAITQLGMFRRRAFKLVFNQPYGLRLEGFELDINLGST